MMAVMIQVPSGNYAYVQQESDTAEQVEVLSHTAPLNCFQLESSSLENPSGISHCDKHTHTHV